METEVPIENKDDDRKYRNLRIFNFIMFFFHAAQGILMLLLSRDFKLPLNTNFLEFNQGNFQLVPVTETVTNVLVGPLVAGFLLMSALAHLLISLPGIYQWYVRNLRKGINKARWVEYSFSSSLMMVVIAMLVGMYDIVTLMLIVFCNAGMILFGWVMELHNQTTKKTNWTSYIFGCILGIAPWIAVALFLGFSGEGDNKAPDFVYWIFFSIFIFFNVFAINMILQYKKVGPWRDYLFGEKVYIILSLVAKSILAWQVWAGTLRPV